MLNDVRLPFAPAYGGTVSRLTTTLLRRGRL